MSSSTVSARLDSAIAKKLEKLSKATNRSKSFLAAEAITSYIEEQSWQIEAINEGIAEADKGNFASENEVRRFFKHYGI